MSDYEPSEDIDSKVKELRLKYPDMNYKDIAEELGETVNRIKHRIQKLIQYGEIPYSDWYKTRFSESMYRQGMKNKRD